MRMYVFRKDLSVKDFLILTSYTDRPEKTETNKQKKMHIIY